MIHEWRDLEPPSDRAVLAYEATLQRAGSACHDPPLVQSLIYDLCRAVGIGIGIGIGIGRGYAKLMRNQLHQQVAQ
jgi:hypothetical protein